MAGAMVFADSAAAAREQLGNAGYDEQLGLLLVAAPATVDVLVLALLLRVVPEAPVMPPVLAVSLPVRCLFEAPAAAVAEWGVAAVCVAAALLSIGMLAVVPVLLLLKASAA